MPTSSEFFSGSKPIALVAGGAGFIGSFVCEQLLERSVKVICLDNWQTGLRENVNHLAGEKNFLLIEGDITKKFTRKIPRLNYILHLAGLEAYLNGEDVSVETLEANSIGTKALLDLAIRTSARFLLGSTIEVYKAKLSESSVNSYFGSGRWEEGEYSHHEAKRFAEALVSEFVQKKGVDARIARLGSVYGPRMLLSTGNLSRIIKQVVYNQEVEIPRADMFIYPVFIADAVEGLLKVLLSSGTKNAIVSLGGPQTSLHTVGQAIAQLKADVRIIYKNTSGEQNVIADDVLNVGRDIISWQPSTSLVQGLDQTFTWFEQNKQRLSGVSQVTKTDSRLKEKDKQDIFASFSGKLKSDLSGLKRITLGQGFVGKEDAKKGIPSSFWSERKQEVAQDKGNTAKSSSGIFLFGAFAALGVLFWIFVLPVVEFGLGLLSLQQFKKEIQQGDVQTSARWAGRSSFLFSAAASGFEQWKSLPGLKNESVTLAKKAKLFREVSTLAESSAGLYKKAADFVDSLLGENSFPSSAVGAELALDLQELEQKAAFLDAEIDTDLVVDFPLFTPRVVSTKQDLVKYRKILATSSEVLKEAGSLLGEEKKKTYLVLFQNNSELRPTGGFIGSFALITFEKGRISNFEVQDVYSADGQLKGHVEPPEPIRQHLGEAGWYLRDSNWNPDFPTSAQRAIWFLDKELGQKVDGVIALDLEFVKGVLAETGELTLPDYSETVDMANLYEKVQLQPEGKFFPGSRAKKDYLTAVGRALIQKVLKDKELSVLQMIKVVFTSLEEKHLSVWTQSAKVNAALKMQGWDGSLRSLTCPASNSGCVADYLYIVEANLGVNKSNYFLNRRMALDVNATPEGLLHTLTVTYKNNSQVDVGTPAWVLGGDYKNYIRFYVPGGAQLEKAILIDGEVEEELEVAESSEKGKSVFGLLALVPIGQSRELKIKWLTPSGVIGQKGELLFLWQKQAGTVNDPVTFRFNLPQGSYQVAANPVPTLTGVGSIGYNTTLSRDLLFDIVWQAK